MLTGYLVAVRDIGNKATTQLIMNIFSSLALKKISVFGIMYEVRNGIKPQIIP